MLVCSHKRLNNHSFSDLLDFAKYNSFLSYIHTLQYHLVVISGCCCCYKRSLLLTEGNGVMMPIMKEMKLVNEVIVIETAASAYV